VSGWKLYELGARLEEVLRMPLDLIPLPPNRFTKLIEARGKVILGNPGASRPTHHRDQELESTRAPFRRFRHVFFRGYGFQLDWDRMQEGITQIEDVFAQFRSSLNGYLAPLP